jgi:hypothetical protein
MFYQSKLTFVILLVHHYERVNDVHLLVVVVVVMVYLIFRDNPLDDQLIKLLLDLHHMHVGLIRRRVYVQQTEGHNHFSISGKE